MAIRMMNVLFCRVNSATELETWASNSHSTLLVLFHIPIFFSPSSVTLTTSSWKSLRNPAVSNLIKPVNPSISVWNEITRNNNLILEFRIGRRRWSFVVDERNIFMDENTFFRIRPRKFFSILSTVGTVRLTTRMKLFRLNPCSQLTPLLQGNAFTLALMVYLRRLKALAKSCTASYMSAGSTRNWLGSFKPHSYLCVSTMLETSGLPGSIKRTPVKFTPENWYGSRSIVWRSWKQRRKQRRRESGSMLRLGKSNYFRKYFSNLSTPGGSYYQGSYDNSVLLRHDAHLLRLFQHLFQYINRTVDKNVLNLLVFDLSHHFSRKIRSLLFRNRLVYANFVSPVTWSGA